MCWEQPCEFCWFQRWFEHQKVRVSPSRMTSLRDGVEGRIEDAEDAKISFVKEMKRWCLRIRFGDGLGFITYIVITSVVIIIYNILCIMLCIHIYIYIWIVQIEWKGRLPGSQPLVLWKTSNIQIRSCFATSGHTSLLTVPAIHRIINMAIEDRFRWWIPHWFRWFRWFSL